MVLAQTNCMQQGQAVVQHGNIPGRISARPSPLNRSQPASHRQRLAPVYVHTPIRPATPAVQPESATLRCEPAVTDLISHEAVRALEVQLDNGESIAALRRFDRNLRALTIDNWEAKLRPVLNELSYNLESFNPAFTAVLLKVQSSLGHSDYVRRDTALAALIQPLAGEYGMHNNQPQGATHRKLFSDWYEALMGEPLDVLMAEGVPPAAGQRLFTQMMRDIMAGGQASNPTEQACYAMGYNLAIEYMADYEKTWMLAAFRDLNKRVLAPNRRALTEWLFLEVHAEGDFAEAEHAALGHHAVTSFVPAAAEPLLRAAMMDHDRDFAVFYNTLADMLE